MQKSMIPEAYRNDPNILFIDPANISAENLLNSSPWQKTLNNINLRVGNSGETIDSILNFVFRETRSLFECDRIGLAFLTDNNERVLSHSVIADYDRVILKTGYSEDLKGSSLEFILNSGKSRIIKDLEQYKKDHPDSISTDLLVKEGVQSNMTSPLIVDDRIVGLFFRSSRKKDAYQLEHVHTHLALADRLSQVVEKVYRIEQLKTAMNNYTEMLGFVSHEIKSPMASIIMDCKLMLEGYMGELSPVVRKRIHRITLRSEHLLSMVREYLDLARIEGGELKLHQIKEIDLLKDIIIPMTDMQQTAAEQKQMKIHIDAPETPVIVKGDPGLLGIVMTNLLSNAIKYGYENGRIDVDLCKNPPCTRLSVRNEGPGFPKSETSKLFKKFSRLQTPELMKNKGTGIGLYTVWRIVKLHRGKITAESEEGKWAEFSIKIPANNNNDEC